MKIRCSKLARTMACRGYVFLETHDQPTNDAAEEGTAAGEYLERLLLKKPVVDTASNGVYIDDDMRFYIGLVYRDILERANGEILCEQRIDWDTRSGIRIRGQYDICFIDKQGRLCIEDLKYGWGIVDVKKNWQLIAYAIGEVIRRGTAFSEISLKIHQPRPHHEDGVHREWVIPYNELLVYKEEIETRLVEMVSGKRDLQTSAACKYCAGAAEACPAFSRLFYKSIEISTEFIQDSLSNDELSRQLDQVKRAKEVIKIKEDSLTELGTLRIKQGEILPGYVQTKSYTNRKWKNGISPDAIKMMTNVEAKETTFMSPAKLEKMGVDKRLISQLSEKKFRGVRLEKKDTSEIGNKIFGNTTPQGG